MNVTGTDPLPSHCPQCGAVPGSPCDIALPGLSGTGLEAYHKARVEDSKESRFLFTPQDTPMGQEDDNLVPGVDY